ncbi:MAG TPA: heavy metal-responsive transcriptional regulator [Victivallales bacterium]|nr:heavy metal-responsive transcriptional regulator [Victivallales bacterium]
MKTFRIGKLAKETGLGIETIRFYERKKLIKDPPRRESGYRDYPEETIEQLKFIKNAKDLGFTLSEIKELLDLSSKAWTTAGDIKKQAEKKVDQIEYKIKMLKGMRDNLKDLIEKCSGKGPKIKCPILKKIKGK